MRKEEPARVGVVSLGCSKNRVDTEYMLGLLREAGFALVTAPADADILIVNTCGFIEAARQESIGAILEYAAYKKTGKCKTLVVTGCLVERYREALKGELPEADILLGVREYVKLPGLLKGQDAFVPARLGTRVLTTPPFSAYLRVADGCDNRCAYCAIPQIRGPMVSVPMPALVDEAQRLAEDGVTELTLIAQDTSGYGMDLYGKPGLTELMRRLTGIARLRWLRVLYTCPDLVTPALIEAMAANEKICDYLDMPLQHISDKTLRAMNRRGDRAHIESVLAYIRRYAPDFIVRTTMLVGFPGETEKDFDELMAFIEEYPFDRLGAFAFSPEEGTPAARMPDQVPDDVKADRLNRLLLKQRRVAKRQNQKRLRQELTVLVERVDGEFALCRSYAEAPEADGFIILPRAAHLRPGVYTRCRIVKAAAYDLFGEELP
ncbi:MAG: 30S ribosomal protein S12 methylthiotransferase RimO [Clostridiales bacterium]|nr:30S ribosomal protein S12 methylthiotransferase RimO [Clostridiales bacterium]